MSYLGRAAVIGAALVAFSQGALGQDDARRLVLFRVEAQPLPVALNAWAEQSGLQVIWQPDSHARQLVSTSVTGTLDPESALRELLKGSGLTYAFVDARTVAIRQAAAPLAQRIGWVMAREDLAASVHEPNATALTDLPRQEGAAAAGADNIRTSPAQQLQGVEEIIVTGSHIRGSQPAGAKVVVIGREEIDQSGYGRVEDVLANLTENFKGVNEDINSSQAGAGNSNRGAEVQLRGLGFGTTLTLVNGYRQAGGGSSGAFTDISSIPLAAVERVEILTDGASAIYGSDAIGGVVNIVMRKDYQGAETSVRFGSANGEADELQLAHVFGTSWKSGSGFIGYQYQKRDDLPSASRKYSSANGDMRSFGGDDLRGLFFQYYGAPGTILNSATFAPALAIPANQDGTNLTPADLIPGANYTDNVTYSRLLPEQEMHSVFLNASQELNDNWDFTVDGRFSERDMLAQAGGAAVALVTVPSSNPFYVDAFGDGSPLFVLYDFTRDLGPQRSTSTTDTYAGSLGLTRRFGYSWQMKFSGTYARERTNFATYNQFNFDAPIAALLADTNTVTALNVFGNGTANNPATIAQLRLDEFERAASTVWSGGVIADGPILQMPGGAMRLALGADYRDERLHKVDEDKVSMRDGRNTAAAFIELAVPVVGAANSRPGVRRLDFSLAARYEDYSDFGTTLDPKLGMSYRPHNAVTIRSTWGTAFRAPPIFQSSASMGPFGAFARRLRDPLTGGTSNTIILLGNNPDLKEETATVWTAGIDVQPIEDMNISATYFNYDYDGQIQVPGPQATLLVDEAIWGPEVIHRDPSAQEVIDLCTSPGFLGGSCVGVAAIVDRRWRNLSVVKVEGMDASVSQLFTSPIGRWGYGISGTYFSRHQLAAAENAIAADVLDTLGHPLTLRLRGNLSWSRNGFDAIAAVNYATDYKNTTTNPATRVDSFTTVDLAFGYSFADTTPDWLANTKLSLTAVNVLDELPPFVNEFDGYDGTNSTVLGRTLSVKFVKAW